MTHVPRRLDTGDDQLIASMFSAARQQRPSARSRHKTLLAIGAGAGMLGGHATANAASALVAPLLKLAVKWTLLGGLVVGVGATAVELQATRFEPVASIAPSAVAVSGVPRGAEPALAPVRTESPAAESAPAPAPLLHTRRSLETDRPAVAARARALASTRPPPQATVEQLEREVALLDRAREALARRDFGGAAKLADQYLTAFGSGRLEPEARYLKMQAERGLGDLAAARSEAARLIEVNPDGPHVRTAEAVQSGALGAE